MNDERTSALRFDEPYHRFELLETETGEPRFFGGWQEQRKPKQAEDTRISTELSENVARLKREFSAEINTDLNLREVTAGGRTPLVLVFMNGMADEDQIDDFILKPVLKPVLPPVPERGKADFFLRHIFAMQEAALTKDWSELKTAVLEGRSAVLIQGDDEAVLMDTRGFACRSIGETRNEATVIGPNEAFTENIRTCVTQLRRIIKTEDFICEFRDAGAGNRVRIALCYRERVCNPRLIAELRRRLAAIDTEMILAGGTIEQLIEEHPLSPVPQVLSTERPDRAAAAILSGKLALLVEGSPQALVLPVTIGTLLSAAEDVYHRRPVGAIIRFVRAFGVLVSVLAPAYFLALTMHHPGLLSAQVIHTVVSSRALVFLPLWLELIFLLLVFQLVREAGLRVPSVAGQTVSIIGGLILGQAAVAANVVSTMSLIIVALTGLGNYAVPDYSLQLSVAYYRIALCVFAALGGLLGLSIALLLTLCLLASLKSFGVPFLSPAAPYTLSKRGLSLRRSVRNRLRPPDYLNPRREGGVR